MKKWMRVARMAVLLKAVRMSALSVKSRRPGVCVCVCVCVCVQAYLQFDRELGALMRKWPILVR